MPSGSTDAATPRGPGEAEERAAFRAACRTMMVSHWTAICVGTTLAALVWWPADGWLYAERPDVRAAMTQLRAGVVAVNLTLLVLRRRAWLRRNVAWIAGVVLVLELAWIGASLGGVARVDAVFPLLYPAPFFTVALLVPLRTRASWALLCSAAVWIGAHPRALPATPEAWEQLSFLAFTAALAVGLGHVLFRLVREQFALRRRLADQQAELERLAAGLEERVAEQATLLLDLNHQAASARLRERERVARDLHDGLGQDLTGARLLAESLLAGPLSPPAQEAAAELAGVLGRSHRSLRQALHDLAPAELEEHGLVPALRAMVEEAARRAGLRAVLELEAPAAPIPAPVAVAAFRVAQEALSNVVRHAAAREVRARLTAADGALVLEIRDDGVGLPRPTPAFAGRFGLLGIQARVRALGGAVELRGGAGTTVAVTLPLEVR